MLFNSIPFLIFFPCFALIYFLTKGNLRIWVMLVGSYFFYGWWDWRFLFLIALLSIVNFYAGQRISRTENKAARQRWLTLSILSSLGTLCYFKYADFFLQSSIQMLGNMGLVADPIFLEIILPVGISFYTFQTMSYTIDLYRGHTDEEKSLVHFCVYVAFFPLLMAGPIVRGRDFLPQLKTDHKFEVSHLVTGLCLICWGYMLKCVFADPLAPVIDPRFNNPETHSALSLVIGAVLYSFQIYGDFAGYSLIAIGLARILGFEIAFNFNRPNFATSFSDFWKRWHISLSTWLRDYLYIPLGGNRKGKKRAYVNVMITMLLGGLWHGAAWTFIFWGGIHWIFLCLQGALRPVTNVLGRLPMATFFAIIIVFTGSCFARIFFRAESMDDAWTIIGRIATNGDWSFGSVQQKFLVIKCFFLVGILTLAEAISFRINVWQLAEKHRWLYGLFIIVCLWFLSLFGSFGSDAFIYFQF